MFALYDTLETILPTIAGFAPYFPNSRQLINNFHDYKGYIHVQKKESQISMTVGCVLGLLPCNILLCSIGETDSVRGVRQEMPR